MIIVTSLVQDSGLPLTSSTNVVTPNVSEIPSASISSPSSGSRPWQVPIPRPKIVQAPSVTSSIWDLPAFAVILVTSPLNSLHLLTSSLRDRVSDNYLRRITSKFYDIVQDCVDEILRDSLIPLEPTGDILASSYASIS